MALFDVSIAVPTYRRERVLLNTLHQLLALKYRAREILVVDQTREHQSATTVALEALVADGSIAWHRLPRPSIPRAMNHALLMAKHEVVLFLDDDIELTSELVYEHANEHDHPKVGCVAGGVVQMWERRLDDHEDAWLNGRSKDPDAFRFNSGKRRKIERFVGANFSVKRQLAEDIGGFDENFVKVAYRYEAEFAERLRAAGFYIHFQPAASLVHLKVSTGGTRSFGHHLKSITPAHSVGRYYYLIAAKRLPHRYWQIIVGPLKAIRTKHHLSRPWSIPVTLLAELSGALWAWWLYIRGPKHIGARKPHKA